jgi:hypothetical protein
MGTTPDLLAWVALLVPLLAGMLLVRLGLRGKRIDDHPLCRRCGFDLYGLPDDATNCSECGADLSVRNAVHIGNRRPRGSLTAVGALLLVVGMGGLAIVATVLWKGADVNAWKPVWLLARELGSDNVVQRDVAIKELDARMTASTLTAKQAGILADRILAWQADPSRAWVDAWGEMLWKLRMAALLPDEKWHAFALNAFDVKLKARPILRRGDPLPYEVIIAPGRGNGQIDLAPAWEMTGYAIGGQWAPVTVQNRCDDRLGQPIARPQSALRTAREELAAIPSGPSVLTARVRLELHYSGPPYGLAAERLITLTAPVELASPESEGLQVVNDRATRAAVKASFGVHRHISFGLSDSWDVLIREGNARATLVVRDLPVDVAYDVGLGLADRDYNMGTVVLRAGKGTRYYDLRVTVDAQRSADTKTATIALRPNLTAARETLDVIAICDADLAFRDLRVRHDTGPPPRERRRGYPPFR